MTENAAEPRIELPDEGMRDSDLNAMTDAVKRRALRQEAYRQGRYVIGIGIAPKPADANGKSGNTSRHRGNSAAIGGPDGSGNRQAPPNLGDPALAGVARDRLPIVWTPLTRDAATRQCGVALATRADRLFRRGEVLAIVSLPDPEQNASAGVAASQDEEEKAEAHDDATKSIKSQSRVWLDTNLRRARIVVKPTDLERQVDEADILFMGMTRGKLVPKHPPEKLFSYLIADPELCPARPIRGIARVPHMDDAGALDLTPGYNAATGIFHDLAGLGQLNVPPQPTFYDTQKAIGILLHPFQFYENFARNAGVWDNRESDEEAVLRQRRWIGEVLTLLFSAVERPFIDTVPLLMINANAMGVGKGELCRALAYFAYGVRGDLITAGEDDLEFKKRIDSMLIEGSPVVTMDNLNDTVLRSDTLASYATEGRAKIRPYGKKGADLLVEGRSLILLNGNGLVPAEDMTRRTFRVDLNTDNPAPQKRHFPWQPSAEARRTRTAMLSAAFTVMRWWRQQRMPRTDREVGSFEEWNNRVGDMVHALTDWHPADSINSNTDRDPRRLEAQNVVNALTERFGLNTVFRSTDVELICRRVHFAKREGCPYSVPTNIIYLPLFPKVMAAMIATQQANHAYDEAKQGKGAGRKATKAQLIRLGIASRDAQTAELDERNQAAVVQSRIEEELTAALAAVTVKGELTTRAIGEWFRKIENRIIEGRKVVRDTSAPRTPEIRIIRV